MNAALRCALIVGMAEEIELTDTQVAFIAWQDTFPGRDRDCPCPGGSENHYTVDDSGKVVLKPIGDVCAREASWRRYIWRRDQETRDEEMRQKKARSKILRDLGQRKYR